MDFWTVFLFTNITILIDITVGTAIGLALWVEKEKRNGR